MYNFLVAYEEDAWEHRTYAYDRTRYLEYTDDDLKAELRTLDVPTIERLKSFPTLFAYEGEDGPVRVGYIRKIQPRAQDILIEYDFDQNVPLFTFSQLRSVLARIGLQGWGMNRTHWAVKNDDLFDTLASAGLIDDSYRGESPPAGRIEDMRFRVALSFPGEKRDYVAAVATELKKILGRDAVFYDRDFTAQLARPNLDTLLQQTYLRADLVVVFLCTEYEQKEWCGLEWRAIRTHIMGKNDHAIMFMRFDQADVSGVFPNDGYVDLEHHTPLEAARMIVERVRLNSLPRTTG